MTDSVFFGQKFSLDSFDPRPIWPFVFVRGQYSCQAPDLRRDLAILHLVVRGLHQAQVGKIFEKILDFFKKRY